MDEQASLRTRFITIVAVVLMLIGISIPVHQGINLWRTWELQKEYGSLRHHPAFFYAVKADLLLQSLLSLAAGWGLLRRRSWAPVVAAFSGGLILASSATSLQEFLPGFIKRFSEQAPSAPPAALLTLTAPLAVAILRLTAWVLLFERLRRPEGRREFPPGTLSSRAFWIVAVAGGVLSGLIYALLLWLAENRPT